MPAHLLFLIASKEAKEARATKETLLAVIPGIVPRSQDASGPE